MKKKNRESLEAVTHTHTHTHSIYGKENRAMVESVYSTEREPHFIQTGKKKIKEIK